VAKASLACVVDLFAGAGGLSIGATQAGARVGASVELDPWACQTLRANPEYHGAVVEADVCGITGADLRRISKAKNGEPFIIVGGPPCQGFSKAAYWTESGEEAAYRRARAQGVTGDKPVLSASAPQTPAEVSFKNSGV
jgi:DNA (cytosine-5)-methyltransferase 1